MKAKYKGIEFEINSREDLELLSSFTEGEPVLPKSEIEPVKTQTSTPRQNMKHKLWSNKDDKFLLGNVDKLGVRVLSRMLGRTMGAVKVRLCVLRKSVGVQRVSKPKIVEKRIPVSKKNEIIQMLMQGKSYDAICKATGLKKRSVYDLAYNLRKKTTKLPNKIVEVMKQSPITSATFSMVSKDKMDVARNMISSCAKSKSKITAADCSTFLGLSVGESKAFMIDVFQQQKKLGYKVVIDSDRLVFQ